MNKKHLGIFAAVTLIVIIAAVVAVNQQKSAVVHQAGEHLFPGLETKVNDVAKIEVIKGEDRVTIQRGDNNWQVADKDNYPANGSKVKETIMKIAAFTTIEAKTQKEENYGKLNVEDPTQTDTKSVLVSLKDASDNELASVVVGRLITGSLTTGSQDKTYVRKNNDTQVWLAKGGLIVDEIATDWLSEELMDVSESRISKVSIAHANGESVVVFKEKSGEGDFILQDIPNNKEPKSQTELARIARILERLNLDDVQKAESFEFPEKSTKTTIQTFDGLVVDATTTKDGSDYLVKFAARFDASIRPAAEPAKAEPTAETKAEGETAAPAVDPHAPSKPTLIDATLVQQEATEINDKLKDWIFHLPKAKGKLFTKPMDELVKDKENS